MITAILTKCGRGLLYIVTLPVLLVVLSIYAVIGVIQFFYVGIKSIIYFFTGRNLFGEFPEDIRAREILEGYNPNPVPPSKEAPLIPEATPAPAPEPVQPSPTYPQYNQPTSPTTPPTEPYITNPSRDTSEIPIIHEDDIK